MASKSRKNSAFFHMSFSGSLVPYEFVLTLLVKIMGFKSILYLQGGQFMDAYINGSKMHRWMFREVMNMQETVFFEGKEGMDMVKSLTQTPLSYFPGYALEESIPTTIDKDIKGKIGIIYFGRIAPNKKIDIIIETFNLLCKKKHELYLTIIGGAGQSKEYVKYIDSMIDNSPYKEHINRYGLSPFSFILEQMKKNIFYLFPTKERCEGHSNSLTEAMSQGLIPIVSDWHFNASVVGDRRLVVEGYEPNSYAECIEKLLDKTIIGQLSNKMLQRVRENFSYKIVMGRIVEEVNNII